MLRVALRRTTHCNLMARQIIWKSKITLHLTLELPAFFVEFWVLVNTTSGLEYLSVYRNATGQGWAIWKDNSGNVGFAARDIAGAYELMTGSITEIDDGNWHHVAVTWNRGTTTATLYIDGGFET